MDRASRLSQDWLRSYLVRAHPKQDLTDRLDLPAKSGCPANLPGSSSDRLISSDSKAKRLQNCTLLLLDLSVEGQRDEGCHMERSQNTILYVSFVPDVAKKRQKALESAGMHVVLVAEPEAV